MINLKVVALQHWSCKLHRFGKMLGKKNMPQFQESVNYKMMQKAVVKHVHTMQVINFQLDCFDGSVHKLSYKLKFIVSCEWSVLVISQSLFTKLRHQTGAVFMLPIHLYFSAAANLYPVKNQPGVNVSREVFDSLPQFMWNKRSEGFLRCSSRCEKCIRSLGQSQAWDICSGEYQTHEHQMLSCRVLNPDFIPHQVCVMKWAETLRIIIFSLQYLIQGSFLESPSYNVPKPPKSFHEVVE